MNVILIGYRCTGKSTTARIMAAKLGWPLVDTDELVQQRAGKTIEKIVADGGWETFRDLESQVVADVAAVDEQIISVGGGAVLREENRKALKSCGKIVLLRARAETIWQRMCSDSTSCDTRPDLTDKGGIEEVGNLLEQRRQIYESAADFSVPTDIYEPDEVAGRIMAWLKIFRLV